MTTTGKTRKAGLEFAVYVRKFGSMKPRVVGGTEGVQAPGAVRAHQPPGAWALSRTGSSDLSVMADISTTDVLSVVQTM